MRPARVGRVASGRVYPPAAIGSAPPGPAGAGPEPLYLRSPGCGGVSPAGRPARAVDMVREVLPRDQAVELGQHPGSSRRGGRGRGGSAVGRCGGQRYGAHPRWLSCRTAQTTGAHAPAAGTRSSVSVADPPTATVSAAPAVRPSPAVSHSSAYASYPVQSQPSPEVSDTPSASPSASAKPSKSPSASPSASAKPSKSASSSAKPSKSPSVGRHRVVLGHVLIFVVPVADRLSQRPNAICACRASCRGEPAAAR